MIITNKALPRRTFLRGAGAALALPVLDAMAPALGAVGKGVESPTRLAFVYVPNGVIMENWTPAATGRAFELTPTLEPLAPFKDQMQVLSGLAHNNGVAREGEGAGDHSRSSAVFLTGAHPKKTEGADLRAGVSVDQVAARAFREHTQLASLEVGLDDNAMVGTCGSGYSCAYTNTLCWSSPSTPVPVESRPRQVFERLFGDLESTDPAERRARIRRESSLLDSVTQEVSRLLRGLGSKDRLKLTEYLDSIRDIERRIQIAEEQSDREVPAFERPRGVPATFTEHARLMADLQVLAFQTDMTRVSTFMMGRESTTRIYTELGISEGYHPLSHHQNDISKIGQVAQIDVLHTRMLAYMLEKLRSTREGDGNLLDRSMIVYGSGLSDGNLHEHYDLPVLLLGGGSGRLSGGQHLQYPRDTPMSNLFLTLLHEVGVPEERFGDSTGKLALPA